ncbi:MAG: FAD-dependent oxidoreductase, partial [Synergistaceae bacterium]|nr:FAD-dependent oxidoreductase [Synergistaceae bacterium]
DRAAIAQALANPKIEPVYNTVVDKIEDREPEDDDDMRMLNLVLKNTKTGETSNLPVAMVFMFVGQAPDDDCVRGLVDAAKGGWITTNDHMETSVEGIFAAGDVRDKYLRQVITAAADGAIAAMAASSYINEQVHLRSTLLEPEHVTAFFYSSIDADQVKLSNAVEAKAKEKGVKVAITDGYRNARMTDKLGLKDKMPALVEISKGEVKSVKSVKSDSDINF